MSLTVLFGQRFGGKRLSLRSYFVRRYPFQREVSRNALACRVTPFASPSASLEESRRGGSNHVTACRNTAHLSQPDAPLLPDPPLRYRLLPCQSEPHTSKLALCWPSQGQAVHCLPAVRVPAWLLLFSRSKGAWFWQRPSAHQPPARSIRCRSRVGGMTGSLMTSAFAPAPRSGVKTQTRSKT